MSLRWRDRRKQLFAREAAPKASEGKLRRDFSTPRRQPRRRLAWTPLFAAAVLSLLALAALRVSILRTRYALGATLQRETELLARERSVAARGERAARAAEAPRIRRAARLQASGARDRPRGRGAGAVRSADLRGVSRRARITAAALLLGFLALAGRAAHLTVIDRRGLERGPRRRPAPCSGSLPRAARSSTQTGAELAVTVPAPSVYAIPREVDEPAQAARSSRAPSGCPSRRSARSSSARRLRVRDALGRARAGGGGVQARAGRRSASSTSRAASTRRARSRVRWSASRTSTAWACAASSRWRTPGWRARRSGSPVERDARGGCSPSPTTTRAAPRAATSRSRSTPRSRPTPRRRSTRW